MVMYPLLSTLDGVPILSNPALPGHRFGPYVSLPGGSRYVASASTTVRTNGSFSRPCRRTSAECFGYAMVHGEA